jgi:hypothetical protein
LFFIVRTLERDVCCVKAAAAWPRDVTGTCHAAAGVSAWASALASLAKEKVAEMSHPTPPPPPR